jgi:hypothetical protein
VQHSVAVFALGLAHALWCGAARAQQTSSAADVETASAPHVTRVVLVASPGMEELVVRFIAELGSLRLEVVRAPDTESVPSMVELEQLAQEHSARVAVRVGKAGRAVDLWLVNPQTHELIYRRVVAEGDAAVVVLRSLEILRGALVDLRAFAEAPQPSPRPVARQPPAAAPEPPPAAVAAPPFWLGVSGALMAAHAGQSVGGGVSIALRRRVGSRFALHAEALAPLGSWSVEGQGGTANVRLGAATAAGIVMPWGEGTLTPGLGLGLGMLALHTQGEANAGFRGTSELNAALFPHARLELALSLTTWLRSRAALAAGFASPRPVLLFGQNREESWLNPLLLSTLGVEIAFL